MATYKYIYWRPDMPKNDKGLVLANVHLLVGYTQETITAFRGMADELRKTFPNAIDDNIRCGRVVKSSYVQAFSIIAWAAYLPAGTYEGWEQKDGEGEAEYCW